MTWRRIAAAAVAVLLAAPAAAEADWSGDSKGDVLAVAADGRLLQYRGTGAGTFVPSAGEQIGSGWSSFSTVFTTGDFSGDARTDLLAVQPNGALLMYRGDGASGFVTGTGEQIGSGWGQFTALLGPGDWTGDGKPDILARATDGTLYLYRGDGDSGFATGAAETIGSGWQGFVALLAPGDWSGDGKADLLAVQSDGVLLLYRGDGTGGFVDEARAAIGTGWTGFTTLASGGDFSGDGKPDILARPSDGSLLLYRGNGAGGFLTGSGEPIGAGWSSLSQLMLISGPAQTLPSPPPASVPLQNGRARLQAGIGCTPPGGRLKVSLRVRRRSGRSAPRVRRVVFFVRSGPRKVDRRRPFTARLRINRPAGQRGRVHARVVYTRKGSKKLRRKTVSRRFVVCG